MRDWGKKQNYRQKRRKNQDTQLPPHQNSQSHQTPLTNIVILPIRSLYFIQTWQQQIKTHENHLGLSFHYLNNHHACFGRYKVQIHRVICKYISGFCSYPQLSVSQVGKYIIFALNQVLILKFYDLCDGDMQVPTMWLCKQIYFPTNTHTHTPTHAHRLCRNTHWYCRTMDDSSVEFRWVIQVR